MLSLSCHTGREPQVKVFLFSQCCAKAVRLNKCWRLAKEEYSSFMASTRHKNLKLNAAMANPEQPVEEKLALSGWKYRRYFSLIDVKGKNVNVMCTLNPRAKCSCLSAFDARVATSSRAANKEGHRVTPSTQQKLDFSAQLKWLTQTSCVNRLLTPTVWLLKCFAAQSH